jgi:hypothetical protein
MGDWTEDDVQKALDEGRGWVATFRYPPGRSGGVDRDRMYKISGTMRERWADAGLGWVEIDDRGPDAHMRFQFAVPPDCDAGPSDFERHLQQVWDQTVGPGGKVTVQRWTGYDPAPQFVGSADPLN